MGLQRPINGLENVLDDFEGISSLPCKAFVLPKLGTSAVRCGAVLAENQPSEAMLPSV